MPNKTLEFLIQYLSYPGIIILLSYLGIILTVYYSTRVAHKKMMYILLEKGDRYVIAFWNACSQAITGDDLYYCYAAVSKGCKVVRTYSTDPDVELIYSMEDTAPDTFRGRRFCSDARHLNFSFDFMIKNQGFLIELSNAQLEDALPTAPIVHARLRCEKEDHVLCCSDTDIKDLVFTYAPLPFLILSFFVGGWRVFTKSYEASPTLLPEAFIMIAISLVLSFISLYSFSMENLPIPLNQMLKSYLWEGFTEVKSDRNPRTRKPR